jgi:hypothetical protein
LAVDGDPDALTLIVAGDQVSTLDETFRSSARQRRRGDLGHWVPDSPDVAERFARAYPDPMFEVISTAAERAGLCTGARADPAAQRERALLAAGCRRLGLPTETMLLDNIPLIGHMFAADSFLNYWTVSTEDAHSGRPLSRRLGGFGRSSHGGRALSRYPGRPFGTSGLTPFGAVLVGECSLWCTPGLWILLTSVSLPDPKGDIMPVKFGGGELERAFGGGEAEIGAS